MSFQYRFQKAVNVTETEATLLVAMIAIEALHGNSAVRMYGRYRFDPKQRVCEIDASPPLGQDLNKVYVGMLQREFGPSAFTVQKVQSQLVAA